MRLLRYVLLLTPIMVWGQETYTNATNSNTAIDQYLQSFSQVDDVDSPVPDISGFVQKLQNRDNTKSNFKFCRILFQKTRQEFLRRYAQYASFSETLQTGTYNCLTGTALYALLLDHFDIPYTIIETNYHIFLLASTAEGPVLFEATDPVYGFVTDPEKIERRIQEYKTNATEMPADGREYYRYEASLYRQVDLNQLQGLMHYNVSIEAYNKQDFPSAIHHLDEAFDLYNSPRISEFSAILLRALLDSNLEQQIKGLYIDRVQSIRKKLPVMANRSSR
jgi:hypothetical protein